MAFYETILIKFDAPRSSFLRRHGCIKTNSENDEGEDSRKTRQNKIVTVLEMGRIIVYGQFLSNKY